MERIDRPGSLLCGFALSLVTTGALLVSAPASAQDMTPGLAPAAPPTGETVEAPPEAPAPVPAATATVTATMTTNATPTPNEALPTVEVPKRQKKPKRPRFPPQVGLRASGGAALGRRTHVYGFDAKLRFRPFRRVAFDFGAGYYAGQVRQPEITYDDRSEVPVSFEFDFFLKPSGFVQIYLMTGPFVTVANNFDSQSGDPDTRHDVYLGYSGGLGMELRFGKHVGVHAEVRGFVRGRVTDEDWDGNIDGPPEYIELDSHGRPTGRGTDVLGGGLLSLGASLYF